MSKRTNHVVSVASKSGSWGLVKSGSARASKVFTTKEQAKKYGRMVSKREKTQLYIHKKDGTIQERNSYGNDPFPPRDRKK